MKIKDFLKIYRRKKIIMDEKDFIRDLLSKTKEQDRKTKRAKYPEGTPERKEIERKFEWEDRFIPDNND